MARSPANESSRWPPEVRAVGRADEREPDFDGTYRESRRAAFSQCVARLQQASGAAVSTLLKIMLDTTAPHASRVRAAECILERASRAIELEDVEARVRQLEANVLQEKP